MNAGAQAAITAATAAATRAASDSTRAADAYGGPSNGDYVAYLEAIERRQLQHLMRSQTMSATDAAPARGYKVGAQDNQPAKPLSATERDALLAKLRAASSTGGKFGAGHVVLAVIGASLLLSALFGDAGIVALLLGVALLWSPLKRLPQLLRGSLPSQRAQVDKVFGGNAHKS